MAMKTVAEIAAENLAERGVVIDLALKVSPELQKVPAKPIKGTEYRVRVGSANPTAAFRSANNGVDFGNSTTSVEIVSTKIITSIYGVDQAVAEASEDGWEVELAREGRKQLSAVFQKVGEQFYFGTAADAGGHAGLIDSIDADLEVNAAGSATEGTDSVWAVKFGEDACHWIIGRGGEIKVDPPQLMLIDGTNGKKLPGYVQTVNTWLGVCTENTRAVARIKNLADGHHLNDDLLAELISKFPIGYGLPDAIFLSRTAMLELMKSRQTYSPVGAPVPMPVEYMGIPLVRTDNIPLEV